MQYIPESGSDFCFPFSHPNNSQSIAAWVEKVLVISGWAGSILTSWPGTVLGSKLWWWGWSSSKKPRAESFFMAGQQFWSLMAGCWEVYGDLCRLKACFYCDGQNLILPCSNLRLFSCFFQVLDFFCLLMWELRVIPGDTQRHPWLSNAALIKGWAGGFSCESEWGKPAKKVPVRYVSQWW